MVPAQIGPDGDVPVQTVQRFFATDHFACVYLGVPSVGRKMLKSSMQVYFLTFATCNLLLIVLIINTDKNKKTGFIFCA